MNILFDPGEDFENLISRAEFKQVASRAAQVATLKAEKAGETIVDLAAIKGNNSSAGDNGSTDEGNSDNTGGSDSGTGSNPL